MADIILHVVQQDAVLHYGQGVIVTKKMRQHETGRKAAAPVEAVHAGGGPRAHQQTVVRRVQQAAQPHEQLPGQPSALIRRRGDQQAAFGDPSAAQGGALPFARAARRKGGRLVGKDRQADGFPPPDKEPVQRPPRQPGVDVGGIIVRQTEQLVKRLQAVKKEKPQKKAPLVDYVAEAERDLSQRMGRACRITHGKKKGRIEIEYYGVDDLNDLLELLGQLPRS